MDKKRITVDMINRFKPGTRKIWLYVLAGMIWSGIGIMLMYRASKWLVSVDLMVISGVIVIGVILALLIHRYGFSRFAIRNIERIHGMADQKPCLFAFQGWTSYPLVAVMISMGIFLREYSHISKILLAPLYIAIGGGLFFSSFHYYAELHRQSNQQIDK